MVFISRPISDYVKMLQKENIEPTLSTAYEQDMSSVFQKDLEYCCTPVSKNEKRPLRSIVLQIISKRLPRGSGKSTIGLAIAYQIFKLNHVSFTIKNNLHFSVDNLGAAVADKIPAGTTEILDEVRQSERFGIGSNYSSARLGDIANISRAYGLNIIVISASEMLGMFGYKPDYYLSADSIEFETDKNMAVIYDSDEYQPRGFVTIKKPQEKAFANMEEEYIKAKMRFISQNLVGEMRDKIKLIDEKVQRLVANDDFIFCINDKERRNVFQETFGTNIPIEVMNQIISKAVFNLRKQGQLDMRNKPVGEKKIKKV